MRRTPALLLPVLVLATVPPSARDTHLPAEPPQDSVARILARYAQASGGDALSEIRTETRRGVLVRGSSGQVRCEIVSVAPRRWHWMQSLAWGDRFAYGFDGTHGWVQDARGVTTMSPRQTLDLELLFDITSPLRMREIFPEMSVTGSERVGDTEATVLLGRSASGLSTELAFDQETGLLVRAGDVLLEDYREVGAVTRPFRLKLGEALRVQLTEIRHDLGVSGTIFERPTTALAAADPVIYRQHDQIEVPTEALDACVGEYQLPSGPMLGVTRQGGHLMLQTPGSPKYEIFPMSETSYFMRFNHLELHFVADETGRVTHLALGADRSRTATKVR